MELQGGSAVTHTKQRKALRGIFGFKNDLKVKKMKILYLNHTTWDWILQRSQLLALEIEKENECVVADIKYLPHKDKHLRPNTQPKKMKKIYLLRGRKVPAIDRIDNFLYRLQLGNVSDYDCIWVCHPSFHKYIKKNYSGYIVYDCMDNHTALMKNAEAAKRVFSDEQELIKSASLIFASSQNLINTIPNLHNAILVRNGFVDSVIMPVKKKRIRERYKIGYFGAIERWFDFNLLKKSAVTFSNIDYYLIGPFSQEKFSESENVTIEELKENRIFPIGIVDHDSLPEAISDYDALLMPFIVNDIILAVDPVKLYEYISYGKPVISIWYPEIDRFEPYVYFYKNEGEYLKILSDLCNNGFMPKYSDEQRSSFLEKNTWERRGIQVNKALNDIQGKK